MFAMEQSLTLHNICFKHQSWARENTARKRDHVSMAKQMVAYCIITAFLVATPFAIDTKTL